ncbi:MAG: hypothetical protein AB1498_09125 [bacterium]
MGQDRLIVSVTSQITDIFNSVNTSPSGDINELNLKTDLFSLFYLQNPVLKPIEEFPTELWINYFFIEGLYDHYSFKNIQSFSKDHSIDSYWITEKIINELKIIKGNKKIERFFVNSYTFLIEYKNADFEDLIKDKYTNDIKKQIKAIVSKIILIINGFLKKIEPVLEAARGHDLAPVYLQNIDDNKLLQLSEKLQNPKYRELIKTYVRSNIKEAQENKVVTKKEEAQEDIFSHNIFYINDATQDRRELYLNWLIREAKEYKKDRSYRTQLTAYVRAGNLISRPDEIETLSFAINLLEVARLEKRNLNVIISKDSLGDKTFIFKNNDEVEIFENNQSYKFPILEGLVIYIVELLSAPTPPKPKFSLGFSSKKKKIFKKPPASFIKFS